eukprot:2668493-Rhodomonas_salina.1
MRCTPAPQSVPASASLHTGPQPVGHAAAHPLPSQYQPANHCTPISLSQYTPGKRAAAHPPRPWYCGYFAGIERCGLSF